MSRLRVGGVQVQGRQVVRSYSSLDLIKYMTDSAPTQQGLDLRLFGFPRWCLWDGRGHS